ncbi:MAG: hypothetical protein AAF547_14550 [Actinomycetota bacterium]
MNQSTLLNGSPYVTKRLAWPLLIVPVLLVAIYSMLSFLSLGDQDFFYSSMDIPVPNNEFLLWSWGGKNSAMVLVLLAGVVTRVRLVVVISLLMLLVGQAGDINAGAQSGTNVFVTWIAFGLVVVQGLLLLWDRNRERAAA